MKSFDVQSYNKNVSLFLKNKGQYLLLEILALSLIVYVYKVLAVEWLHDKMSLLYQFVPVAYTWWYVLVSFKQVTLFW